MTERHDGNYERVTSEQKSSFKIVKWNKNKAVWTLEETLLAMCSFVNFCEFLHTEGYRWIDVYSQGEFPGRVWGCWYQLWVESSCLWFLEHLSTSRWTHPVCWQNPARTNTQTHQHGQTQQMWLLWHQKSRNIKIWTKPPCVSRQHDKQDLRKIIKCFDKVW